VREKPKKDEIERAKQNGETKDKTKRRPRQSKQERQKRTVEGSERLTERWLQLQRSAKANL